MRGMKAILLGRKAPAIVHMAVYDNVLTGLVPDLYQAVDVVSRELVGMIPSVFRNASAERAAVDEAVVYPIAPALVSTNITPSMSIPEPPDVTIGTGQIKITKAKAVEFGWVGEEQRGLNNGIGVLTVQGDLIAQAIRTLTNEVELDLWTAGMLGASRAYGTAGTTPFATNIGETAQMKKLLDDNGAPAGERSLVLDTSAGAALRTLSNLTRVSEAGTSMTLRDGELLNLNNFMIKESAAVGTVTPGSAANATTNTAGYAVGARTITLASAGTGLFKAGDVVTFANDTNKYVLVSGDTDVSNGGSIVLAAPGLRKALPASAVAITQVAARSANLAFNRSAIHLVARAPALPEGRDAAIDSMMVTDVRSGMTYEVRVYAGRRKLRYEIALAWGVKAVKTENIGILLG